MENNIQSINSLIPQKGNHINVDYTRNETNTVARVKYDNGTKVTYTGYDNGTVVATASSKKNKKNK